MWELYISQISVNFISDFIEITYNDLATAQPFANTIDYGELQGKYIKEFMETAATPYSSKRVYADVNLLQVSGKITFKRF